MSIGFFSYFPLDNKKFLHYVPILFSFFNGRGVNMRNKYLSSIEQETTPFESSEEAWFWYCLCEKEKSNGRSQHRSKITRPCETTDIFIAVKKLLRLGILKPYHIKVLAKYGFQQVPPHPHFGDSSTICRLWQEALDFLERLLIKKGIVFNS